jgi:hypothetical protein
MSHVPSILYDRWAPLSVAEVAERFADAPFAWGLAGGYAVERFVGRPFRPHGDIDIVVFRDEQLLVQHWLSGWQLFAADPPGTLRPWTAGEELPYGIHDIWGLVTGGDAWQLQLMLLEATGDQWFSRRDPRVRGRRSDLIVRYRDVPCLRVEVQLFYKAKSPRPKDEQDFTACLPLLDGSARGWLREQIRLVYSDSHPWFAQLPA